MAESLHILKPASEPWFGPQQRTQLGSSRQLLGHCPATALSLSSSTAFTLPHEFTSKKLQENIWEAEPGIGKGHDTTRGTRFHLCFLILFNKPHRKQTKEVFQIQTRFCCLWTPPPIPIHADPHSQYKPTLEAVVKTAVREAENKLPIGSKSWLFQPRKKFHLNPTKDSKAQGLCLLEKVLLEQPEKTHKAISQCPPATQQLGKD